MDDEYYLGQIIATGFGFVPRNFAPCNGQLLSINTYPKLFALIGNRYGGDGTSNFAVPDLRGRTPVGAGASLDETWQPDPYKSGARDGVETFTLEASHLPGHTHELHASKALKANLRNPVGNLLGTINERKLYRTANSKMIRLVDNAVSNVGNNAEHENMQPFQVISFCIALDGLTPPRP
ncbi:tail fiber protein [Herbaspirillum seropedicae]|nr:tail fiber protein [Herbaspirillum sp. alder98]